MVLNDVKLKYTVDKETTVKDILLNMKRIEFGVLIVEQLRLVLMILTAYVVGSTLNCIKNKI